MKQFYEAIRFQAKALKLIEQANNILEQYAAQGFTMSLRQLYYQFVARDLLENTHLNYKHLGKTVSRGRVAGLIDWDHIEDRNRTLRAHASWDSPEELIGDCAKAYKEDRWAGQSFRPEVWVEKAALLGVIEPICREYRVPYFATIGNRSQTEMREAGERFVRYMSDGLTPLVLHLADHDPTGLDMTRDIRDRLWLFTSEEVEVRRIALNMDQVELYNPPPNFAKETDSRFASYAEEFGDQSWELDALSPSVLAGLIRAELDDMIEDKPWQECEAQEERNRDTLNLVVENWAKVQNMLLPPPLPPLPY
jgi:hypothetical protein